MNFISFSDSPQPRKISFTILVQYALELNSIRRNLKFCNKKWKFVKQKKKTNQMEIQSREKEDFKFKSKENKSGNFLEGFKETN